MITNSLRTESAGQLAMEDIRFSGNRSRRKLTLKTDSIKQPFWYFPVEHFVSEYIWPNLVLAAVLLMTIVGTGGRSVSLSNRFGGFLKRAIAVMGAVVCITLTAPFFVILPILIKLDSPGPIFYKQIRVGHNRRKGERRQAGVSNLGRSERDRRRDNLKGRPFSVIKFRTMVADAERKCGPIWATPNDPRITHLGKILRKTRLDEIPQFINILQGDMSLVGPRPERPKFVLEFCSQVENYDRRLAVRPGLTGLAQIENGYDSSMASVVRKVHYDLHYIQHWSLWQDIKIMLKTVGVVVTGKGAF